jgi:hypothetical protein
MKKLFLAFALFAGAVTTTTVSHAQISVSFNIGRQPLWGPTGYDYARYYYLPDVDAYYSVADQQFVYNEGGRWVFRPSLPGRYRNFDLYNGYKVVVNDANPWMRNNVYATKYRSYRGRRGQAVIRDSRDQRYYEIANHPHHNEWRGNGNGRDQKQIDRRNDRNDRHDNRNDIRRDGDRSNDNRKH